MNQEQEQNQTNEINGENLRKSLVAQPVPPVVRKSLKSGLMNEGAVSENERPQTSVSESINFDFDVIGSARLRLGTTALGNQIVGSISGMHYYVDTVDTNPNTKMIATTTSTVYYLSSGTWAPIRTSLTSTLKSRFSTFLNFVFMVNGVNATTVWDGVVSDGFVTTGNAASAPIGQFVENFRQRMWIMGNPTYPSRLYYSSIPSSVATPIVTWNTNPTVGTWIDISPSDGDFPTALQRFTNVMLVFKTNRIYRVFDIGQTDPDPYYMVGTSSQESVVETKVGVYFHHSSGFYQYNTSGQVQEISRPIWDIVKAIPGNMYPNIVGWVEKTGDHICWYVGTVTIKGVTYTNLTVRYCISTMTWTHRQGPTQITASQRRQPLYFDGTNQFCLVGDNVGNVIEVNTGNQDVGTDGNQTVPISYSLVHGWETCDGLLTTRKTIMQAMFSHYQGTGSKVEYQTEEDDVDDPSTWKPIGALELINTGFNTMDIKARKFRFRITGQSSGQTFIYNGYEIINAIAEFLQYIAP